MEKHNKDLKKIRVKKDFLHATLMHTNAKYWKPKTKQDSLNAKHNKLQRDYRNMEHSLEAAKGDT